MFLAPLPFNGILRSLILVSLHTLNTFSPFQFTFTPVLKKITSRPTSHSSLAASKLFVISGSLYFFVAPCANFGNNNFYVCGVCMLLLFGCIFFCNSAFLLLFIPVLLSSIVLMMLMNLPIQYTLVFWVCTDISIYFTF